MGKKYIGKIIKYNELTGEVTFKLDFLDVDKMNLLIKLLESNTALVLEIKELRKRMKTHNQLKRYFAMLQTILFVKKIRPSVKRIEGLDRFVKESLIECDVMEFQEGFDRGA